MSWLGVRGRACVSMAQGALAWMGAASPVGEAGPGDEGLVPTWWVTSGQQRDRGWARMVWVLVA